MDFTFTEEQTLIRDSIAKWGAGRYDFEKRRALARAEGFNPGYWKELAELGLFAAALPEAYGGLGGGPVDVLVIMEELGKVLALDPFIPCVVLAGGLIARLGTEAQKEAHLTAIAAGERIFAFAQAEPKSRFSLTHVATTARADGSGFVLDGHKAVVIGAPFADHLVLTARTGGGMTEAGGISAFIVKKDAPGITTRDFPTIDGLRASEITFENVKIGADALLGPVGGAHSAVEAVVDHGIAALAAEAIGIMGAMNAITHEYARTRKQFGQTLASFQVLQHRLVDMFMAHEQSVSMAYMAAMRMAEDAPVARARAASATKVQIGQAGRFIGQAAIQIHGGIGMTEEYRIGHYFKRLTMIDTQFGNVDWHLRRFSALGSQGSVRDAA